MAKKGAQIGNKNSKKLSTPELKKLAYESYCKHISKGLPHKAWYFEHGALTLTWQTMEKYLKEEPLDFNPNKKNVAEAKSYNVWFGKGVDMMTSTEKCQPAIYQMIMRNVHGWDKETKEEKEDRLKEEAVHLNSVWNALEDRYKAKN